MWVIGILAEIMCMKNYKGKLLRVNNVLTLNKLVDFYHGYSCVVVISQVFFIFL